MNPALRCAALLLPLGACATFTAPGSLENAASTPVCLSSLHIQRTEVPDDRTILFYMRDHSVWKNTLVQKCPGLSLDSRGFTYEPTDPGADSICGNLVTIRTNTNHLVCSLGAFSKVRG
jgi:hypothetical protein